MTNKNTRNFSPSDDALILQQPITGIGLKTLAKMIRTSQETLIRRADELGVSLSDDHGEAFDTRTLRCRAGSGRPATGTAETGTRRPKVNEPK